MEPWIGRALTIALSGMLCMSCASAGERQGSSRYPAVLHGVWQGSFQNCQSPDGLDSDTRIEISANKLLDYEQWNDPVSIVQISKKPLAWKVVSMLQIDGYATRQEEVFVLSGQNNGMLTIADENRSAIYARCD
ncbi:hypothetical protein [Lysobacter fragariae]